MKEVKVYFFLLSLLSFCGKADAIRTELGKVRMRGAVIESACTIDVNSQYHDQAIEIPVDSMNTSSKPQKKIKIKLVNCLLFDDFGSGWHHFRFSFDGNNEKGLFFLEHNSADIAFQLSDSNGHILSPGSPITLASFEKRDKTLNYYFQLSDTQNIVSKKSYHSTIRFKIDYY